MECVRQDEGDGGKFRVRCVEQNHVAGGKLLSGTGP